MASVRIKFRPSASPDKKGVIYYQIIAKRKVKLITTSFRLFPEEWDRKRSKVIFDGENEKRLKELLILHKKIESDHHQLVRIMSLLKDEPDEANKIVMYYKRKLLNDHLFPFMESCISELKETGRKKTSSTYTTTLRSFRKFRNNKDIRIDLIDAGVAKEYENWLIRQQICPNTTSFYMRILRAVYNRAVSAGFTPQHYPFRNVYTGIEKTVKRAVDQVVIHRLKKLDLSKKPNLIFARDMFLFSLYTRGMAFVDIAHLTPDHIINNYIEYKRQKTGQTLRIKIEPAIREIIDKHGIRTAERNYLFPILSPERKYESSLRMQNHRLHLISSQIGLENKLSSYIARHTWASLAKKSKIPIRLISEGMGHENERTTRIYLASLDQSMIDQASARLLAIL